MPGLKMARINPRNFRLPKPPELYYYINDLNGNIEFCVQIDPNDNIRALTVEYSEYPDFQHSIKEQIIISKEDTKIEFWNFYLTGLMPEGKYHFRFYSINDDGQSDYSKTYLIRMNVNPLVPHAPEFSGLEYSGDMIIIIYQHNNPEDNVLLIGWQIASDEDFLDILSDDSIPYNPDNPPPFYLANDHSGSILYGRIYAINFYGKSDYSNSFAIEIKVKT